MSILNQMISKYKINTEDELLNALKEIFQEIVLLGLYRGNFFKEAAFYGGTCLRILHNLDRFSEDLDFSLLNKNTNFNIENYFKYIVNEFNALGIGIDLKKKEKKASNIESAFLKNNTSIYMLDIKIDKLNNIIKNVNLQKNIKIKIEVDINPPLKFETEVKFILMPVTFSVISMTLPNLFAGKMHAVLCRQWLTRVKGRDWYDFEWYVKNQINLNLQHLQQRMLESNHLQINQILTKDLFMEKMFTKIDDLNISQAKDEVKPFIKDSKILDSWSKDYFKFLTQKIICQ